MECRRFGRSGHLSTVAIFGAAAFYQVEQSAADRAMQSVIDYGVNHIDVAHPTVWQRSDSPHGWRRTASVFSWVAKQLSAHGMVQPPSYSVLCNA